MEHTSIWNYFRLKIIVTLLRLVVRFTMVAPLRRDAQLAKSLDVHKQRIQIPARDGKRYISADLYLPSERLESTSTTKKSPVLVNLHGSGFMFPLLGSDSLYCAQIARDTGIIVLDADYRKSPEIPFPGPLEDVEDVVQWVASQPHRFDLSRLAVSGFSAGGTIALAAASSVRKIVNNITVRAVVAFYPITDLSLAPEAKTVPSPINPHPHWMGHMFADCYVPQKHMRTNPRASPSYADPCDFPSTVVIVTCEGDTLGPEARALAEKLDDGKRKVVNQNFKATHHGFDKGCKEGTKEWEYRKEAYTAVARALSDALKA